MAIPFLSNIKLNGNQIKELVVDHKSGGQPTEAYHGQLIFRTDENKIYINHSTTYGSPSWSSIAGDITSITAGAGLTTPGGTTGDVTINAVGGDGITVGADEIEVTVDGTTLELSDTDGTGSVRIKDGGVATAKIADDAVTLAKLAHQSNDTVFKVNGSGVPTAGTIDTVNITADAVTGAKIADDAIDSEHYTDGSIDTAHIADEQVTFAKMQHIASNRILGRTTAMAGDIEEITPANHRPFLKSALGGAFGSNALSIGTNADTITIPGNLNVTGDTTYSNETIQIVDDNKLAFRAGDSDTAELILTADDVSSDKTITMPAITGKVGVFQTSNALITATPAELNVMDGGTSATSTTIVDADRFVMNDAGTMKQVAASDVKTYIETFIATREFVVELDATESSVSKTSNTYTVTHGLGTRNVLCQVIETSSSASTNSDKKHQTVNVDVDRPDNAGNTVDVLFGQTVTDGAYKILITKIG
jgi:hypothetical protein